jgi:GAF domain-containing protein
MFKRTQAALTETATMYEAGRKINEAQKYEDLIWVLRHYTKLGSKAQHITINYFDKAWQESSKPTAMDVLAYDSVNENRLPSTHFSVEVFPEIVNILRPDEPIVVDDIEQTDLLETFTKKLFMKGFNSRGVVFVPLSVGGQWLGFITLLFEDSVKVEGSDLQRMMAVAGQIAVSLQTMRLVDETKRLYKQEQDRLKREQRLRQIAAHVRSSTNVELVLQTAVQEIGKALGRETFVVLDVENEEAQPNGNGQNGSARNGSY